MPHPTPDIFLYDLLADIELDTFADPHEIAEWDMRQFAPPPHVSPSKFVTGYRRLTKESGAAEHGIYSIARTPYVAEPLDKFFLPSTRKLTLMANVQSGKTVGVLENIIFHCVHNLPRVIVHILETKDKALEYSKSTIDSTIETNEGMRMRFHILKSRSKRNTLLYKEYIGGSYRLKGANTPTSFSQYTADIMLLDDVDRWKINLRGGGDPITLAEGRIARVHDGKVLTASNPTISGASLIEREYALGTQAHYTMQCPLCKHYQVFVFSPESQFAKPTNDICTPPIIGGIAGGWMEFDKDNCTWAAYHCEKCGKSIDEKYRTKLIAEGRWKNYNPKPSEGVLSYHFNEIFTTINTSWLGLCKDFLIKKKNRETLRTFINEKLGETFSDIESASISAESLGIRRTNYYNESDGYTLPAGILVLVASCDVQINRVEMIIVGYEWRENHAEPWHILHKVFWGSPEHPEVWNALDKYLTETEFKHARGITMPITTCFIDCGAWQDRVLDFTTPRMHRRIYGSKGFDKGPLTGDPRPAGKHNQHLYIPIGKDRANERLLTLLNDTISTRDDVPKMHFNHNMQEDYFEQLTNVRKETSWQSGMPRSKWIYRDRNQRREILHMWTYNLAALYFSKIDWASVSTNFSTVVEQTKAPQSEEKEKPSRERFTRPRSEWNL